MELGKSYKPCLMQHACWRWQPGGSTRPQWVPAGPYLHGLADASGFDDKVIKPAGGRQLTDLLQQVLAQRAAYAAVLHLHELLLLLRGQCVCLCVCVCVWVGGWVGVGGGG